MSDVMKHGGIKLYYLNPFLFKGEISCNNDSDISCNEICSINSWFYVSYHKDKRIECYDINRILVDSKDLEEGYEEEEENYSFGYFKNAFIFGLGEATKLKIM